MLLISVDKIQSPTTTKNILDHFLIDDTRSVKSKLVIIDILNIFIVNDPTQMN